MSKIVGGIALAIAIGATFLNRGTLLWIAVASLVVLAASLAGGWLSGDMRVRARANFVQVGAAALSLVLLAAGIFV